MQLSPIALSFRNKRRKNPPCWNFAGNRHKIPLRSGHHRGRSKNLLLDAGSDFTLKNRIQLF